MVWTSVLSFNSLKLHNKKTTKLYLLDNPVLISKLTWLETMIQQKPVLGQQSTLKKHVTLMSSKPEPVIWSHDTGQEIPCFDNFQLTITWIFNIIYVQLNQGCITCFRWSMAAMFHWVGVFESMCTQFTLLTCWPWKKLVVTIVTGLWFVTANRALLENNNILTWFLGFQVKIENFGNFFCP